MWHDSFDFLDNIPVSNKKKKVNKKPKGPTPFEHEEIIGLCRRFVKDETLDISRDSLIFTRVYKKFPDEKFWRQYQLGFKLNCMAFFLTQEGREKVKQDLALFRLDIQPHNQYNELEAEKVSQDAEIKKATKTVSDLFGKKKS